MLLQYHFTFSTKSSKADARIKVQARNKIIRCDSLTSFGNFYLYFWLLQFDDCDCSMIQQEIRYYLVRNFPVVDWLLESVLCVVMWSLSDELESLVSRWFCFWLINVGDSLRFITKTLAFSAIVSHLKDNL